ncbi:MAG TPA: prolipoprotein diacylglyceryl transferase family protein [Niastella sp.]|nr:prolipoprotein diacylglyceryl transferase family protein [Niastella sp.]
MYPNLYYAFKDIFGAAPNGLRFINSFGFFVALSFLASAYVLTLELKRKERAGLLSYQEVKMWVGKQASMGELLLNFLLGFLLGYKIIGLFLSDSKTTADPQQFIFSSEGSWPTGITLGLLFAGLKWWEKHKQRLDKPEERTIRIWPHDRVGDLVIYAALFGFLGAKIFHNLENWQDFKANPIEALLSFSGLTFYGGLICAAIAIYFYSRKHRISFRQLCDAMAPTLILAYSLGRIGCQVAGDGDWGVLNSAYVTVPGNESKVELVDSTRYQQALNQHSSFYLRAFQVNNVSEVPHISVKAPGWLPNWMFAYSYPHNVVNEGVRIPGCEEEQYCNQLPIPVFPTPFYETVVSFFLFLLLWSLRKKMKVPGTLFGVYLIVNGIERFFVEQIRVNTKYDIFGFHPTQAELIAVALVITGAAIYFVMKKKHAAKSETTKA